MTAHITAHGNAPTIVVAGNAADCIEGRRRAVALTQYTKGERPMIEKPEGNGLDGLAFNCRRGLRALALSWMAGGLVLGISPLTATADGIAFDMVRSATAEAANCLADATAHVTVVPQEGTEFMKIKVKGVPANTGFDVFVIQLPSAPFGLSWYQGDITTNAEGIGKGKFLGRFNVETFIVAPGSGPAPVIFTDPPFPDASSNPATAPVHTYHVGLWFDSPDSAAAAGCPATVTPFNGEHHAGIQALSTRNFANDQGPLRELQ